MQKIFGCCCCALIIVTLLVCIDAHRFEVLVDEERLFEPCMGEDAYGDYQIDDLFDVQNFVKVYGDKPTIVFINADIVTKIDIPTDEPIKMKIEFMLWSRGRWASTMFSMKREDLCKALRDPKELWYSYTKDISVMKDDCPPKTGMVYKMENVTNHMVLQLPSFYLHGKFKVVMHFRATNLRTCMIGYFDLY